MGTLVVVRHGQSLWNLENRFSGWSDIPLTDRGRSDAVLCARVLKVFTFDLAITSRLVRCIDTLDILLKELNQHPPVIVDSALNERHYGSLQGLNKAETALKYGEGKVQLWRRSYFTRPPDGESLEDTERRVWPFFQQYILPHLTEGKTVLVSAHGNSMRPIVKNLEGISPEATAALEIGLCTPYVYRFSGEKMTDHEIMPVEGIVTKGASISETIVKEGRV